MTLMQVICRIKKLSKKPLSVQDNGFFAAFMSKKLDYTTFLAKIIDNAVLKVV
ncbi:hypothetical protein DABAL43B_2607 [Psychrobacter sp. DAB_AL43B]|nr:hypothetical protein DABAL43B_2607 [Psychrobacter sp. DAB_AL43B]